MGAMTYCWPRGGFAMTAILSLFRRYRCPDCGCHKRSHECWID